MRSSGRSGSSDFRMRSDPQLCGCCRGQGLEASPTAIAMPITRDDPTASIRLLVRLLRPDAAGIRRCLEERREVLDELAAVALNEGLSVALLRALAGSVLTQQLSKERQVAMAKRRDRQATRYVVLVKGLARVASMFEAAGVPFMLLKGPLPGRTVLRGSARPRVRRRRPFIRRADRRRAFGILEEAGFARRSRVLCSESLTTFFVHGFDFVADGVNVDLHWSLSRHPSFRVDETRIWERKKVFLLGDRSYAVLSDEDEVTLEVLALLRDIARGRPKIKNVADLIQVVATIDPTMAWDALFASSRSNGTYGPLVNVLSLCLDVADAHDLAPRLAATLARHSGRRVRSAPAGAPLCVPPARAGFANKLWAARSHDAALGSWFVWWAISLPFRRAVHGWRRPAARRPLRHHDHRYAAAEPCWLI